MRVAMRKRLWQHCAASHLAAFDAWKTWQEILLLEILHYTVSKRKEFQVIIKASFTPRC